MYSDDCDELKKVSNSVCPMTEHKTNRTSVGHYIETMIHNGIQRRTTENFKNIINSVVTSEFNVPKWEDCDYKIRYPIVDLCKFNSTNKESSPAISTKAYSMLIEMEFNQEAIISKFHSNQCCSKFELNNLERERIEELQNVLHPLKESFLSLGKQKTLKQNLHKCLLQNTDEEISVEFQRDTMRKLMETSITLLISLTKKLKSFDQFTTDVQTNLLRSSVIEIMTIRSLLVSRRATDGCGSQCDNSSTTTSTISTDSCEHNKSNNNNKINADNFINKPTSTLSRENVLGMQYRDMFRQQYMKLKQSMDEKWYEDTTIFFLVSVCSTYYIRTC